MYAARVAHQHWFLNRLKIVIDFLLAKIGSPYDNYYAVVDCKNEFSNKMNDVMIVDIFKKMSVNS